MTPGPTVQDAAANNSDDSAADGIQCDDANQQEREHHEGCTPLPVAAGPRDRNAGNADEKRTGEQHASGLGEPKPAAEPGAQPALRRS